MSRHDLHEARLERENDPNRQRGGKARKTVKVVKEPPKQPHCSECLKTLQWLRNCADVYECSRVDCPQRRPLTACPGGKVTTDEGVL